MKTHVLKIFQVFIICFLLKSTLTFAQTGQNGIDFPVITHINMAVIVIDFPDTPQPTKEQYFPTTEVMHNIIFNGQIAAFFRDMSYGQFTFSGDVFGYFTHQNPGIINGNLVDQAGVLDISTITIPGFDISRYDVIAMVSVYDGPGWGVAYGTIRGGTLPLSVNGIMIKKPGFLASAMLKPTSEELINTFNYSPAYFIPTANEQALSENTTIPLSVFDHVFAHEFGHVLGLMHANSRTNSSSFDYEPEVVGNNCLCYAPGYEAKGDLLNDEYGNVFDLMGNGTLGSSFNMAFRDLLGWTNTTNRYSIKDYGHFTAILHPVNERLGVRSVEIRLPYQFVEAPYKNRGYFLEVRTASSPWDNMLSNPQLSENNNGIMVNRIQNVTSQLLDMSPSPNITVNSRVWPDRRDVVLKPGMVYNNKEIKLSNIIKNADGSFNVDIDVIIPTRIEQPGLNKNLNIYPNPVTNELIIEIKGNTNNTYFNISNSIGKVVFKGSLKEKTTIQTTSFPPGLYFIKLENGKTFEFKKVIKE